LIAKYVPEIVLGGARFIAVMSLGKFEGKWLSTKCTQSNCNWSEEVNHMHFHEWTSVSSWYDSYFSMEFLENMPQQNEAEDEQGRKGGILKGIWVLGL
jgi:hypothetical protein